MCGIAGFVDLARSTNATEMMSTLLRMISTLRRRGPDDSGCWTDPKSGVALGHRRLSILDLSPEGHQPMFSSCGRYCVVFNGEIYNFLELRRRLEREGCHFRGHSDTEVLVAAVASW